MQRLAIYPAPWGATEPVVRGGRMWRWPGRAGRTVYALHVPAARSRPTLVLFHGNGESLADQGPLIEALGGHGLGVLAVEYPGYGLARAGSPSETTLYEDALTALGRLHSDLGGSVAQTVLMGHSLGTAVASELAHRGLGARLVLLAPFTSMTAMIRRTAPFLPRRLFVDDAFDTAAKAPSIAVPTLIVHGTGDRIVPTFMGQRLAELFPQASLYLSEGAHHNDLFAVDGPVILRRIVDFALGGGVDCALGGGVDCALGAGAGAPERSAP